MLFHFRKMSLSPLLANECNSDLAMALMLWKLKSFEMPQVTEKSSSHVRHFQTHRGTRMKHVLA